MKGSNTTHRPSLMPQSSQQTFHEVIYSSSDCTNNITQPSALTAKYTCTKQRNKLYPVFRSRSRVVFPQFFTAKHPFILNSIEVEMFLAKQSCVSSGYTYRPGYKAGYKTDNQSKNQSFDPSDHQTHKEQYLDKQHHQAISLSFLLSNIFLSNDEILVLRQEKAFSQIKKTTSRYL